MGIAHECAAGFDTTKHEAVAVLASQLPRIRSEALSGKAPRAFGIADYEKYLAGVRGMLRLSPESLARLAGCLCDESNAYANEALNSIVLPTLAKSTPEARRKFLEYQPSSEPRLGVWAAILGAKRAAQKPGLQARHTVKQALARARDLVRRNLSGT